MTDITTANAAYSKIADTENDSSIVQGLVSAGIIPPTFRVIKGSITIPLTGAVTAPILDSDGNPIILQEGAQVIAGAFVSTTALSGGTSCGIGFASTSTGTNDVSLLGQTVIASIDVPFTGTTVVGATDKYLVLTTVGTFTAGAADITIIVI